MQDEGVDDVAPSAVSVLEPPDSEAATRVAVADVRCKDATDLVEIWSRVEAEFQANLLEQHHADMVDLFALRAQALDNARRIVEEHNS